ncbi:hypothetical protein C0993_011882 [Termitomyces sp. T159_Od127]|nr:hypothetical protein C0993_011882 [Termitomyces sp. T159_Od127]
MPLKAAIIPHLDAISPESRITGACNTIVKVPSSSGHRLVGQNTDILGVRNTLLRALQSQFPSRTISPGASYPPKTGAGVIVGGGATARSAAHALSLLGLSPLFLVNRDPAEVRAAQSSLPHLSIIHLQNSDDAERHLGQPGSPTVLMAVGAIRESRPSCVFSLGVHVGPRSGNCPSHAARTRGVLDSLHGPHHAIRQAAPSRPKPTYPRAPHFPRDGRKPQPTCPFSCAFSSPSVQTPHHTNAPSRPRTRLARRRWRTSESPPPPPGARRMRLTTAGQATIEQGLAQQRMWRLSDPSLRAGSDQSVFDAAMEASTRTLGESMPDVVPPRAEVDRACARDGA